MNCMWLSHFHTYTQSCGREAEVIQSHENVNFRNIGQREAMHGKYKRLNLVAVRLTAVQVTELSLCHSVEKIRHNLLYKAWTDKDALYML
jgi:hypothetical protein